MWMIRNKTVGILLVDDFGLELKHGDIFDLDLLGRDKVEASAQIAVLFNKGAIEVVSKDVVPTGNTEFDILMERFGGELLSRLSNEFSDNISNISDDFLQTALAAMQAYQISSDIPLVVEDVYEDSFKDISADELQAELFNATDILDPNFDEIGKKHQVERTDNIVEQLRKTQKLQGNERE